MALTLPYGLGGSAIMNPLGHSVEISASGCLPRVPSSDEFSSFTHVVVFFFAVGSGLIQGAHAKSADPSLSSYRLSRRLLGHELLGHTRRSMQFQCT